MFGLQRKDIEPGLTLEDVIFKDNRLNEGHRIVRDSAYDTRMAAWLKFFRRDQFLILDAGDFKYSPAKVLQRVEDFLGLARFITPDHFVWNEQKGYYCIKTNLSDTGMACYSGRRGKQRIDIYPQTKQILKVISDLKFEDSLISLGVLFTGDMNKN